MLRLQKVLIGWLLTVCVGGAWAAGGPTRDCPDCPEMVSIPAGTFTMGSGATEHKVTIPKSFALSTTLVTQGDWRAVMGRNPSEFAATCGDQCPVDNVSWEDIQIYILRLNAKTGKHYRLPTEAEWEYACRAGTSTLYCGSNTADEVAWYEGNSDNHPHPVATKKPNAWGLYDMSGNLWQWVEDCYHNDLQNGPANGTAWEPGPYPTSTEVCVSRVLRGGSWHNTSQELQVDRRSADDASVRVHSIGFRLAKSL